MGLGVGRTHDLPCLCVLVWGGMMDEGPKLSRMDAHAGGALLAGQLWAHAGQEAVQGCAHSV